VAGVNIPVGLLIWAMIVPMLVTVDFGALHEVRRHGRGIAVAPFVIRLVKPFSMAALAWRFVRQLFAPWLPAAPCTAMVFVWSRLSSGAPCPRSP
jgi:ACR3 family arsenite transporter